MNVSWEEIFYRVGKVLQMRDFTQRAQRSKDAKRCLGMRGLSTRNFACMLTKNSTT